MNSLLKEDYYHLKDNWRLCQRRALELKNSQLNNTLILLPSNEPSFEADETELGQVEEVLIEQFFSPHEKMLIQHK